MHIPLKPPAAPTLRATPSTPMLRSDTSTEATQSQRIPARKSESNLSRVFNTLPPSSHISFSDLLQQSAFSDDDEEEDYGTLDRRGQKPHQHNPGSPRRLYERFLDSTPGVVRQGDGWSSGFVALPPIKPAMGEPSSMASLRERARMLLHGNHTTGENFIHPHSIHGHSNSINQGTTSSGRTIIDLANKERRNSQPLVHGYGTVNSATAVSFTSTVRPNTPGAGSVLTTGTGTGGQKGWGIWKGLKSGLGMKKGKATGERMEELRA